MNAWALPAPRANAIAEMGRPKAFFGAIPFRALADRGLSDLELRVLAIVSAHDNMSLLRGGQGCWAGTDRIAMLANANTTNVSTSISKLERLGYLRRGPHPIDKRRSTLRVVWDAAADRAAFKGDTLPEGKIDQMKRDAGILPARPKVSCPQTAAPVENTWERVPNIPKYTPNRPSGEPAPPASGVVLAKLERRMRGDRIPSHEVSIWIEYLEGVVDRTEFGSPDRGRAQRLLDELSQ